MKRVYFRLNLKENAGRPENLPHLYGKGAFAAWKPAMAAQYANNQAAYKGFSGYP